MFGRRYFGGAYFGARYFGDGGSGAPSGASAAQIWAYVLSNGKSAGQNVVEILAGIEQILARACVDENVQGGYTVGDVLRILAAVAAGKSTITSLGGGLATVEFEAIDDSVTTVSASMDGSERTSVTLTPTESS
jgi:hypothetical protein